MLVDNAAEGVDQHDFAADLFSFAALILVSALALMLAVRVVARTRACEGGPSDERAPSTALGIALAWGCGLALVGAVGGVIGWLAWEGFGQLTLSFLTTDPLPRLGCSRASSAASADRSPAR